MLLPGLLILALGARAQPPAEISDAAAARVEAARLLEQAQIELRLDDLETAEKDFLDAIALITSADGEFGAALIDAYRGLAGVFAERGDYPEAVGLLERARHVSNRNYGLFNLDQAELLDELSAIYERAGDTRQAQATQREVLEIAQRHFGGDDVAVVPYHYRLAGYYERARMRSLARMQYEQALELIREDPHSTPADTLEPLTALVHIDTVLGEPSRSQSELVEALELAPDAPPATRAEAFAVLGDRELAGGRSKDAQGYYADAYAVFRDNSRAEEYFRGPRPILLVPPPSAVDWGRRRNAEYAWGSITLSFALSPAGKAERIAVVRADPPGLMDALYVQRLAEGVFRPRLVAGLPVATSRLRYSHEFRYYLPEQE